MTADQTGTTTIFMGEVWAIQSDGSIEKRFPFSLNGGCSSILNPWGPRCSWAGCSVTLPQPLRSTPRKSQSRRLAPETSSAGQLAISTFDCAPYLEDGSLIPSSDLGLMQRVHVNGLTDYSHPWVYQDGKLFGGPIATFGRVPTTLKSITGAMSAMNPFASQAGPEVWRIVRLVQAEDPDAGSEKKDEKAGLVGEQGD